ncbi:MAG: type IV pilin [Methanomassiliicoccales archaeon]|jgi:hypothetical protein
MTNKKSNYHRDSKNLRKSRSGVSEIIGNLLILAITVSLFTGVLFFVTNMPPPQDQTLSDFSAQTGVSGSNFYMNITHKGGQSLTNAATNIYLFKNDVPTTLYINTSNPSIGTDWNIGEVWIYSFNTYNTGMTVRLMIVDKTTNNIVWQATLAGNKTDQNTPPIIGTRGLTPSPVYDRDPVYLYATVTDLDSNLAGVWVDASSLGLPSNITLTDTNHDGTFTSASSYQASYSLWNGRTIFFNAYDSAGKNATAQFVIAMFQTTSNGGGTYQGPYTNYSSYLTNGTYPPDASGGQAGETMGEAGTTFYYIRRASDGNITRNFNASELIMVEIYSDTLRNLAIDNNLLIYQPLTGNIMTPPSSTTAFQYGGIYGDFYRYNYTFNAPTIGYTYPLQIKLKDNIGTVVNIWDQIIINNAQYPKVQTFILSAGQLVPCANFSLTDTIYVKLTTLDIDGRMTSVFMNDLTVSDYSGRYIVRKTPPMPVQNPTLGSKTPVYNAPVSAVFKTDSANGVTWIADSQTLSNDPSAKYTFYFKPIDANAGWWLPRRNSYTLTIDTFQDVGMSGTGTLGASTGEIYHSLTCQFNITAPRSMTDIITGIGSGAYTWSSSGASWTNSELAWFKNGEVTGQWQKIQIADTTKTYSGPVGLVQSDLDGDGRQDLAVGFQDPNVGVAWYRSQSVAGTSWSNPYQLMAALDGTPGGPNSNHWAAGGSAKDLSNADVTVYATQDHGGRFEPSYGGTSYTTNYDIIGAMAAGNFGNGHTDLVVSLIHVVVYSTSTSADDANNNPSENTAMFFNRGIYVLWNNGGPLNWKMTPLYGTRDYFPAYKQGSVLTDANGNNNPAAIDIATGDFNQDGFDDIAAVYETGVTKIWLSQWNDVQSVTDPFDATFNSTSSLVPAASVPTVPGTAGPWDLAGRAVRIKIADMDGNGYPDIVRTSAAAGSVNTVYVINTMPATVSPNTQNPNFEYGGTGITAKVAGSKANLIDIDNKWENLTEVYQNSSIQYCRPTSIVAGDNTLQTLSNLTNEDGRTYNVSRTQTLSVAMANPNPSYNGLPITSVTLRTKYSVGASHTSTNFLEWSIDGTNYFPTTIKPTSSQSNANLTFDLKAAGVNTWAKIQTIYVRYYSNGATGTDPVRFDYIWVEAKFAVTRQLEWNWQVTNVPTEIMHNLTINAKVLTAGESFNVSYSTDNETWFPLFQITSTTQRNYSAMILHTVNSKYYIKIEDVNRAGTDIYNDTLCVNMVSIRHYSPTVYWVFDSTKWQRTVPGISSPNYITAIAVADVGKSNGDHRPDGKLDIVVGTTLIGSGDATHALFVITNSGTQLEAAIAIPMVAASAAIGTNKYDVKAVDVGDFNGDGYIDIAVAIGFSPGYSYAAGSTSTLWIYFNQPSSAGWQFNEQPVNVLDNSGSVINIKTGYVDLTFLWPLFGVFGIVVAEAVIERADRKRKE